MMTEEQHKAFAKVVKAAKRATADLALVRRVLAHDLNSLPGGEAINEAAEAQHGCYLLTVALAKLQKLGEMPEAVPVLRAANDGASQ